MGACGRACGVAKGAAVSDDAFYIVVVLALYAVLLWGLYETVWWMVSY